MLRIGTCLFAVLFILECDGPGRDYSHLPKRSDVYDPYVVSGIENGDAIFRDGDTVLLVSAVRVPPEYDWRRDTAMGISSECEIVIYRNLQEEMSFRTGYGRRVGTEPDSHHFLGSNFYTEFTTEDSTFIKRNGESMLGFEGREKMVGMLENDGSLHTLGVDKGGQYFTYRIDGVRKMQVSSARPYGSLNDDSCPESGALYRSGNHICFTYRVEFAGVASIHLVSDGTDTQLSGSLFPPSCTDVKIIDGALYGVAPDNPYGYILVSGGTAVRHPVSYNVEDLKLLEYPPGGVAVKADCYTVTWKRHGYVVWKDWDMLGGWDDPNSFMAFVRNGWYYVMEPAIYDCYFFHSGCLDVLGDDVYAAYTPKEKGLRPFVMKMFDTYEMEGLNGFLTGISVYVSPPRK